MLRPMILHVRLSWCSDLYVSCGMHVEDHLAMEVFKDTSTCMGGVYDQLHTYKSAKVLSTQPDDGEVAAV